MALLAQIKLVQGLSTPPAGQALIGVLTTTVVASNGNNAGVVTWAWSVIDKPPGSTVAGPGLVSSSPTFSFAPDVRGGYLLELTVRDAQGVSSTDRRVFQVTEASGYIIPPFEAKASAFNFGGQTRGWAKYLEELLRFLIAGIGGAAAVIFDGGGSQQNLRSTKTNQSPINNTKTGIVNFASRSSGGTAGAVGDYVTISGGDRHEAGSTGATICGGRANECNGVDGVVAGGTSNTVAITLGFVGGGQGNSVIANAGGCVPGGSYGTARRSGEMAHADGPLSTIARRQASQYMVRGLSTGAPVVLLDNLGGQLITQYGRMYLILAKVVLQRTDAVGQSSQTHILTIHQDTSGFCVIDQDSQINVFAGSSGGVVAFSVTGADGNLVATLTTGGETVDAFVVYDWAELTNGGI